MLVSFGSLREFLFESTVKAVAAKRPVHFLSGCPDIMIKEPQVDLPLKARLTEITERVADGTVVPVVEEEMQAVGLFEVERARPAVEVEEVEGPMKLVHNEVDAEQVCASSHFQVRAPLSGLSICVEILVEAQAGDWRVVLPEPGPILAEVREDLRAEIVRQGRLASQLVGHG